MIRKFFILVSILIITFSIYAKQITFNDANQIAENWTKILEEKFDDQVRVENGHTIYRGNMIVAYVFDFYPKGYMIVSAEDYLPPVKFYSLSTDYKKNAKALEELIFDTFRKEIKTVNSGKITLRSEYLERNRAVFDRLLNRDIIFSRNRGFKGETEDVIEEVKPLITSSWGQGSPYNDLCPIDDGKRAPAGCVAIAFAQIFNYWEWPDRGVGSFSYYDKHLDMTIYANFDKEYQWWFMNDRHNTTQESKKAVAELCYDVSVAAISTYSAKWGTGSTFRWTKNFVKYLKYSPDMKVERYAFNNKSYNLDEWFDIAKNQIDNGLPVAYGIDNESDGHATVIDGYRISDNIKMVHINFGWSGVADGYYAMNDIDTDFYDFLKYNSQDMVINIYPYPGYRRPVGKAPDDIHGYAYLNRSAFLSEYVCKISWSESSSQDKRIEEYIIYRQKNGQTEEVARVNPNEGHHYEFRVGDYNEYIYSVGVKDKNGKFSDIPEFIKLKLEN